MEIKVFCGCGARYKFDITPVNGRMPFAVNCPVCGVNGTEKANQNIRETLATTPSASSQTPPRPRVVSLRVVGSAEEPPPPTTVPFRPPAQTATSAPDNRFNRPQSTASLSTETTPSALDWMTGGLCALMAASLGFGLWYGLNRWLGFQVGLVAWGVGWLTALGARAGSRRPSFPLGIIAGICAALAIFAGQWLSADQAKLDGIRITARQAVEARLAEAGEATAVRSDTEIRNLLARRSGGVPPTADQVHRFREKELPELREFIDSALSRADYERSFIATREAQTSTWVTLARTGGLLAAIWIFLGVFTAFRVARG